MPPQFSGPESIMSESNQAQSKQDFEGSMFLYSKPELLTREDHGHMGLSRSGQRHEFVKDVKGMPVVASEIQSAQKHYPVVFSDFENPALIAIVGIIEDRNRFVDEQGQWDSGAYIPSYVRCHPFALARRGDEEYAVIIDVSSAEITENPDVPFFDGDELSSAVQPRLDMCGQFNIENERTRTFCQRVKELGLLAGQRVTQTMSDGSEEQVADYVTIDVNRLQDLDKDVLMELHKDGSLSMIYAQIFSLENWNRLIGRRNTQLGIR